MNADPLQPSIVKIVAETGEDGLPQFIEFDPDNSEGKTTGWFVWLGDFPIGAVRMKAAADAVVAMLANVRDLPQITPADLLVLCGFMPGQSLLGRLKNKTLAKLWGRKMTETYYKLADQTQTVFEYGGSGFALKRALAGQQIDLSNLEVNQ